jgi:hypothetical protein
VIIIFLLAHLLLRAIPQMVMFSFVAVKKLKQIIIGSQCTNSSAGFMTTLVLFCKGTIKIAFSYFSHDYFFSTCTFSLQAIPQVVICFYRLQKLKQIIIGSPGFQRSAPTLQLGL